MGELNGASAESLTVDERWKVGLVTSRFNVTVTERLEQGARERLNELGLTDQQIEIVRVPGAVEIPLAVKLLLEAGCDGVVALGAVIRGETDHYEYVCNAVERGCSQLQLEYCKPVAFGVLTTDTREQAMARAGGSKGHKGAESVDVLVEMLNLKKKLGVKN